MFRRLIATAFAAIALSLMLIAPASAIEDTKSEFDIEDSWFVSSGDSRSFVAFMTGEEADRTVRTMADANDLCVEQGFDRAIGIVRYRESGERQVDVTCAGGPEQPS